MDSQDLRQRGIKQEDDHTTTTDTDGGVTTTTPTKDEHTAKFHEDKNKKMAMAKRGFRSLSIAVGTPLLLTLTNIYFFGGPQINSPYHKTTVSSPNQPNYLPPLWALHAACIGYTALMGFSAWLFWAGGGLRKRPDALYLYLAQMGLSLAWDPLVFKLGANWAGLFIAVLVFGLGWRCAKLFREVNEMAGDLVLPCLVWAGMVGYVSIKLGLGGSSGLEIEK